MQTFQCCSYNSSILNLPNVHIHFSDHIAVMYLGRVVEQGMSGEVLTSPLHPYTKALIVAVPEADPANRLRNRPVVPGETPSSTDTPTGCRFHPRCPQFIAGHCDAIDPVLVEVNPGRSVACHLYVETKSVTANGNRN